MNENPNGSGLSSAKQRRNSQLSIENIGALRWAVQDDKYERKFIVNLTPESLKTYEHGECECTEFYFRVHLTRQRTTCVHIDFLIAFLTALEGRLAPLRPFKVKRL